ncbi:hypothetical protein FRB90_011386 [Tulasnella sp. 427]|nr:hypothetical protein FRB90_011386 [Tulasnella sp. 427]
MTSYQQTTYGHRKLPPLTTTGQRFHRGHRTTESIDLNSPPLSPVTSGDPWCWFDFTWETFAVLYVFGSAAYCSVRLLVWLHNLPSLEHVMRHVHSGHSVDHPLDLLLDDSPGFRLSKLVTLHPLVGTADLQLDFIRPAHDVFDNDDITACLQVTEEDIVLVPQWIEAWNGPVSLVVSIPHPQFSPEYADALSRLRKLSTSHPTLHKAVSIHTLPTSSTNLPQHLSTNAQLNLARLYAKTSQVALFAEGALKHPPTPMKLLRESTPFPVSFYQNGEGTLPIVTLPRNATRWCPERWFGQDASEYDQCLWYFVLHFGREGDAEYLKLAASGSKSGARITKKTNPMKVKYQAEACMMAAREQVALGLWADRKPGSRADWIETMCKRTFDPSGITLLESEPEAI